MNKRMAELATDRKVVRAGGSVVAMGALPQI
jgi:hypothetical protein